MRRRREIIEVDHGFDFKERWQKVFSMGCTDKGYVTPSVRRNEKTREMH